jgi:hypothetical protein
MLMKRYIESSICGVKSKAHHIISFLKIRTHENGFFFIAISPHLWYNSCMKYGNIQETKRIRNNLQYVRVYDEREIEEWTFYYYVYCYETGLLIGCSMGEHFLAIPEHIADLLERKGLRTFEEGEHWNVWLNEFSEEEIQMLDYFIRDDLKVFGSDCERDLYDVSF